MKNLLRAFICRSYDGFMFTRVLAAYDGSPAAEEALRLACALAGQSGGKVTICYAVEPSKAPLLNIMPAQEREGILSDVYRFADDLVKDATNRICPANADVATYIVEGSAPDAILAATQDLRSDVIVIGTHGRSGLSRVLLGSVAEGVIRASKIPVITVQAKS
jgi:nucleotide-binding universal stress UspA family protein